MQLHRTIIVFLMVFSLRIRDPLSFSTSNAVYPIAVLDVGEIVPSQLQIANPARKQIAASVGFKEAYEVFLLHEHAAWSIQFEEKSVVLGKCAAEMNEKHIVLASELLQLYVPWSTVTSTGKNQTTALLFLRGEENNEEQLDELLFSTIQKGIQSKTYTTNVVKGAFTLAATFTQQPLCVAFIQRVNRMVNQMQTLYEQSKGEEKEIQGMEEEHYQQ